MAIATAWNTAEYVAMQQTLTKIYFIQDFEPWFYPMGEDYLRAEQSYRLGLMPITIGRWLSMKVSKYYSGPVPYCDFGVDTSLYAHGDCRRDPKTVCAIFQPSKDRRLSSMLLEAIHLACRFDKSLNFKLFGCESRLNIDKSRVEQLGVLTISECAELYASCSVGISLSASNPSRLPFEMLASGLSVVEILGQNTEYDFNYGGMHFAQPSAEGIASALLYALDNPTTASIPMCSNNIENQMFLDAMLEYLNGDLTVAKAPIKNTNSVVPIDKDLYRLSHEFKITKYQIEAEAQQPIYSNHVRLVMNFSDVFDETGEYRAACWLKPDQSDLQWHSFSVIDNCLTADIDLPEIDSDSLLRIHLYAFGSMSDEPIFIGEITQLLSMQPCTDTNLHIRKISFGNYKFQIEFNNSRSYGNDPGTFSAISSLKRFFNH